VTDEASEDALAVAPLDEVEAAIDDALVSGDDQGLRVLGYGEITLVVGWPADSPRWACKRLPTFPTLEDFGRYCERFGRYLEELSAAGVTPVPSALRSLATVGGGIAGYVVQPVLPVGTLGPDVLRSATAQEGEALLRTLRDHITAVAGPRVGIDGQVSNWALVRGQVQYLDVTTPMLFGPDGRLLLDMDLFLAAYPWLLRGPIRRFVAPGVVGAYREARHVLVDLAANLIKERLEAWIPVSLAVANDHVTPVITEDEVRHFYRSDARLWEAMLRLRRADRSWQRRVRRRSYPFLLPHPIER
jgi:hypothetical protein